MGGMGCALSIHQKECRKSFGCALYIGARYLPENTVNRPGTLGLFYKLFAGPNVPKRTGFKFRLPG
jgi:hypothetical protein